MRHKAGLNGDPIGEPRICWKNCSANRELGHFQRSSNNGFNVSDVDLSGDV